MCATHIVHPVGAVVLEPQCTCYFMASVAAVEQAVAEWQLGQKSALLSECLAAVHRDLYRYQISPPCEGMLLGNPLLAADIVKRTLAEGEVPHDLLRRYHESLSRLWSKYARPPRPDRCSCIARSFLLNSQ